MTTKKSGKLFRAAAVQVAAVLALFFLFGLFSASAEAKVLKINEAIYMAVGRGPTNSNTFLVVTNQGNVIIDTSGPGQAADHHQELKAVNAGPVKYPWASATTRPLASSSGTSRIRSSISLLILGS